MNTQVFVTRLTAFALSSMLVMPAMAAKWELTPYVGYSFSSDINDTAGNNIEVSDDPNYGFAIAWQDSPSGQGQVLLNYVKHDFTSPDDGSEQKLEILYAHFSGVAQFRQNKYITTVSLGAGGSFLKSDENDELYPSATVALGTRYEINPSFSVFTEIRAYATLTDEDNELFCKNGACYAKLDGSVYVDTTLSVGFAFAF